MNGRARQGGGQVVAYADLQCTKAPEVLRPMGLSVGESDAGPTRARRTAREAPVQP